MTSKEVFELTRGREIYYEDFDSKGVVVGYSTYGGEGFDIIMSSGPYGWLKDQSYVTDHFVDDTPEGTLFLYVNKERVLEALKDGGSLLVIDEGLSKW